MGFSARVVWHLVPRQFHWAASLQQQAQVGLALASGSSGISVGVPLANRGCLVKALLKLWWHRFKPRGEGVWVRQRLKVKTEIFTTFSTTFMTFQRTCCRCDRHWHCKLHWWPMTTLAVKCHHKASASWSDPCMACVRAHWRMIGVLVMEPAADPLGIFVLSHTKACHEVKMMNRSLKCIDDTYKGGVCKCSGTHFDTDMGLQTQS